MAEAAGTARRVGFVGRVRWRRLLTPEALIIGLAAAIVCYLTARHFFDSFEEPYAKLLSYLWSFFAAALTLVLGHWLLFYGAIAQPTLLLVAVGYGLAALYYLDHHDKLSRLVRVEIIATTCAIVIAVIVSLTVNVVSTVRALLS